MLLKVPSPYMLTCERSRCKATMLLTCYLVRSPQSLEWPAPRNSRLCLIISRHIFLSEAIDTIVAFPMSLIPVNDAASSFTQFSHDLRGLPRDRLPCLGVQLIRYFGSRSSGILITCPYHRSRLAAINVSMELIRARLRTSAFLTRLNHLIRRIRRRQR